jgi:Sap-like sulfolipid-1-addressing protein
MAAVETLILTMLGLGLAVAVCSPVSVVTVIVLLSMPVGRRRAIAFVLGWLVAIVLIGAVTVFVLHGQDFSSSKTTPSKTASAVEILVGCIIVLVAVRAFRRRSRAANAPSAETPKWLGRLEQTNWLLAALVGAFMLTYSLTVAAASEILKADVSMADGAAAFGVYALASITTIVAPIVVVLVAPERAAETLRGWRRWLLGNSRTVGLVALMVIGAILSGVASTTSHELEGESQCHFRGVGLPWVGFASPSSEK